MSPDNDTDSKINARVLQRYLKENGTITVTFTINTEDGPFHK